MRLSPQWLAITIYIFCEAAAIESWVGLQLLSMGGSYLQPKLQFERLTYHYPRTIVVEGLTLSSPYPARPGQSVVILAVKRARVTLTEIPHRGQPIKFSQVTLEYPEFRAIAITPGSGGLVGFSNILKGLPSRSATSSIASATSSTAPESPLKLSDWLLIRRVEIVHGLIRYDPRLPNTKPMELDDINARLDLTPSAATPGIYAIATTVTRKPIFELNLRGQFNIDTLAAQLTALSVKLDMRNKKCDFLPPEIQAMLKTFEITGQLDVSAAGKIPLADFRQSALRCTVNIANAGFAAGQYHFTADTLSSAVDIADGIASIQKADARLLGGEVNITGTIPLDAAKPAQLDLAQGVQIAKTLRVTDPNSVPLYAGTVAAKVTFSAPLGAWSRLASGNGTFSIRQGRIDNIPLLGGIIRGVSKAISKTFSGDSRTLSDTANATFTLDGNHIQLDELTATSSMLALRGSGTVGFDGQLDLRLNGGPMEHLQNVMGDIGKAWATVSDDMAGYRVTGTLLDPKVSFEIGDHSAIK